MFVIKWKENGKTHEKTYDSKAGLQYRRRQIIKKFGEKAILSEVQATGTGDNQVEINVGKGTKEPLRGKIDPGLSRIDDSGSQVRLVESNWNQKTKSYTSRMYGADFGRSYYIMEPDGSVSLKGSFEELIKNRDKKTLVYNMPDGRKFDGSWPVKERKTKK